MDCPLDAAKEAILAAFTAALCDLQHNCVEIQLN